MTTCLSKRLPALIALIGLMHGAFAGDTFTGSKTGDFMAGEQLARCAAFYDYLAELSTAMKKPAAAENFRNLSRGWSLAGMVLLTNGATRPKFDAHETSHGLRSVELTAIKARVEVGGDNAFQDVQARHAHDCDPFISMQMNVIAALRQNSAWSSPGKVAR